jgi:hypothetical protein
MTKRPSRCINRHPTTSGHLKSTNTAAHRCPDHRCHFKSISRIGAIVWGTLAESSTENLFLKLDDVEAERSIRSPFYIGSVVLFRTGIRDTAHHEFRPAHFFI